MGDRPRAYYRSGHLTAVLFATLFVMKKSLALALGLVLAASLLLWSSRKAAGTALENPTHVVTREKCDLLPPEDASVAAPPTEPRSTVAVTLTAATDDARPTAQDLDWVVRGRVIFTDGASGALPRVRLRLAAYDDYELAGAPFATAEVASAEDGSITWPLVDPERTVSIRATLLDVPGYDARCSEHHLAVLGEGPIESIRVFVNPRDAWVEGVVVASSAAPDPGAPIAGAHVVYNESRTTTDTLGAFRLPVPSRGYGSVIVTSPGFHRGGATPGGLGACARTTTARSCSSTRRQARHSSASIRPVSPGISRT